LDFLIGSSISPIGAEGEDEMSEPKLLDPTPELPDDTQLDNVDLPARIRNVLAAAGLETVGEVRETSDEILLSFQDLGKASVAHLRETLGLPSTEGVRPSGESLPDLLNFQLRSRPKGRPITHWWTIRPGGQSCRSGTSSKATTQARKIGGCC
jgi:hypothetical protein